MNSNSLTLKFLYAGMGRPTGAGPFRPQPSMSAAINRWTGKPHEHNRAKARRLKQLASLAEPHAQQTEGQTA